MWASVKKPLLAGAAGLAVLLLFVLGRANFVGKGDKESERPPDIGVRIPKNDPDWVALRDRQKDRNAYYDASTFQELVKLAEEGDEWAVREIAWPEDHPFHKKGRPFFKNTAPHPKGLIKHSGYYPNS